VRTSLEFDARRLIVVAVAMHRAAHRYAAALASDVAESGFLTANEHDVAMRAVRRLACLLSHRPCVSLRHRSASRTAHTAFSTKGSAKQSARVTVSGCMSVRPLYCLGRAQVLSRRWPLAGGQLVSVIPLTIGTRQPCHCVTAWGRDGSASEPKRDVKIGLDKSMALNRDDTSKATLIAHSTPIRGSLPGGGRPSGSRALAHAARRVCPKWADTLAVPSDSPSDDAACDAAPPRR